VRRSEGSERAMLEANCRRLLIAAISLIAKRVRMRDGEKRSDEWKVVRYFRRQYNALAVASLLPFLLLIPSLVASFLAFASPIAA